MNFSGDCSLSPPDDHFTTPPPTAPAAENGNRKRDREPAIPLEGVESSASPDLKKGKQSIMKRTPQPTFTQSKLTSMLQTQPPKVSQPVVDMDTDVQVLPNGGAAAPAEVTVPPANNGEKQDLTPAASSSATVNAQTVDFFLKAMKKNTDEIIQLFTSHMSAVSKKVEENLLAISDNRAAIAKNSGAVSAQGEELGRLEARVRTLEQGSGKMARSIATRRAVLSEDYLVARRSLRLWPIQGTSVDDLWAAVERFLRDSLSIPEEDLNLEDIEAVRRVADAVAPDTVHDEVVVVFFDRRKRDLAIVSSTNLAGRVDRSGRPTAGTRLEIPPELKDTFRLLSRFGTRLRARHGEGTKRHVKFDNYEGTLFTNIKLPGDESWTKVTADMARDDLEASLREENAACKKRMATKLIPDPRERLSRRPAESFSEPPRTVRGPPPHSLGASSSLGQRPRWAAPPSTSRKPGE